MILPYRTRRILKRLLVAVLILFSVALALTVCWFLWLQRYVVYTEDGAKLDFSLSMELPEGEVVQPPTQGATIDFIYADEQQQTGPAAAELTHFTGYYLDVSAMKAGFDDIFEQIALLPDGAVVAVDMKDPEGDFYYASSFGHAAKDVDLDKLAQVLTQLKSKGCYLIARIPAFQDKHFFLDDERTRVPYGLPRDGGNGSLWLDKEHQCYWFNPASDGTLTYLIQIISELRSMGFHEVILNDFRFPNTDMISFPGNQLDALNKAAATLVSSCTTDSFAVSFVRKKVDLTVPEGRTRLYLQEVTAAEAASLAAQTTFADNAVQLGFFADTNDTRFDAYCVLRPLEMAR